MKIKPIKSETDYQNGLQEIDFLMDAKQNTSKGDILDVLTTLVESYEERKFPIDDPDPIEAIVHRMESLGMTRKDLQKVLGTNSNVLEILSYKRPLTLSMIRRIHHTLQIPAESLIQSYSLK